MMQANRQKPLTISELTRAIKQRLESGFTQLCITGEILDFRKAASGNLFFALRDNAAKISAIMFRLDAERVPFQLNSGMEIVCWGGLTLFESRGEYQIRVDRIEPVGIGAEELALRQLRTKLAQLGYFNSQNKRPLPVFPKSVAIIASKTGAAIRDMLEIFAKRWPLTDLIFRSSLVQGEEAAKDIVKQLQI